MEELHFEELSIDFGPEELELIKKLSHVGKFQFPVVLVGETAIGFNRFASALVPDTVKWFCSGEYIIGLPGNGNDPDCFRAHFINSKNGCRSTSFPAAMREKKVKKGYYKVYKFRDGFAFKRYEPLEER